MPCSVHRTCKVSCSASLSVVNMKDELSLYSNLTQCLQPLSKLRQSNTIPPHIAQSLRKLEKNLRVARISCQARPENDQLYSLILELLVGEAVSDHTLLQIYFSQSPYWEHYHRNVVEIAAILARLVEDKGEPRMPRKFERRFTSISKVMAGAQGIVQWRPKYFSVP